MTTLNGHRTLDLGELDFPLEAITRTAAVVGQKGTGKTSTAVVLLEEAAAAGARFAVMDPTGAWSGLRSSADGEGPGLDCVVMGGFSGDVPLSADAGEVVARLVVEEGYSVVCDLERMPKSDQVAFVADFAETAYHLCRSAVTIVVDEAPRFVPQSGGGTDEDAQRCKAALTDVVMLGRRKGMGSVLISQRPAKLHKDVLEQADLVIAHRLMGANDRKAIAGWLEDAVENAGTLLEQIPTLERGQAVVLAPEYRLAGIYRIRPKRTYDSSATPDVGAVILDAPRGRADVDLAELEQLMGQALEAAQENDPAALRRRIDKLQDELADARAGGRGHVDEAAIAELEAQRDEAREGHARVVLQLERAAERVRTAEEFIYAAGRDAEALGQQLAAYKPPNTEDLDTDVERPPPPAAPAPAAREHVDRSPAPVDRPAAGAAAEDGPPIKAGAWRMMNALLRAPRPLTRAELATIAVVRKGGTMSDYLSALRTRGWLVEHGPTIGLTPAGVDAVRGQLPTGARDLPPLTPEQVAEPHLRRLKAGARRMLEHLMRSHPDGFTRAELSRLADVSKGGTFSDYLSSLKTRGLAEERARRVYAGEVLYLWKEQQR